jgi:protoporphyrinogen oxidase
VNRSLHIPSILPFAGNSEIAEIPRISIVGGGPGGLLTAYFLQKKLACPVSITIYEAASRLGGKIQTARFDAAPVCYEVGAAEFYDYSPIDEDSLKELITELGLLTTPMGGNSVILNNRFLGTMDDVESILGSAAKAEIEQFYWRSRSAISRYEFYDSQGEEGPSLVAPGQRFDRELSTITHSAARHYVETLIHSDLAAEPQDTNTTYGYHNYLMNDSKYMQLYGILGGNEQLVQSLTAALNAEFQLNYRATSIQRVDNGKLSVEFRANEFAESGSSESEQFDFVIMALPLDAVSRIRFGGTALHSAMAHHFSHFNHQAHYLRISILFETPFWQGILADSFCMLDQFDGCCLYDESSRTVESKWGVLGWLLGGKAAQKYSERNDLELIDMALDSLPSELTAGRSQFIEGKVHRWIGAVNAMPGGESIMPLDRRHQPEPQFHGNFFAVGDYLFDSTINGVLDSAEYVSDWIAAQLNQPL